jgi:fermentation-respiration switch protein FrsA (DUF1100 family)
MNLPKRRKALNALIVLAVVIAALTVLWAAQRRLIYFPDRGSPAVTGEWQEVTYETSDGLSLTAWFVPPGPDEPAVIVFNGNAGNRLNRTSLGAGLAAAGMGVLLTDYRGYGGNPGHPTEGGLARDARAAAAFLKTAAPGHQVVYFGESLGAAVAIELATHAAPAALVLRSPFTSLTDVGRHHYPWLPVGTFLKDKYPSQERIGSLAAPILIIAGEADTIVPVTQSKSLFASAPGPKELLIIEGADHNDFALVAGPELVNTTARFIAAALDE